MSANIGTPQLDPGYYDVVRKDYTKNSKESSAKVKKPEDSRDTVGRTSGNNEARLSAKAQEFLKNLRKQYGDYDFFIGNGSDDLKSLAKSGSKEFSVIFSSAEIERMANDEAYAKEKMQGVEGAVRMSKEICERYGFASALEGEEGKKGTINKISIAVQDDGSMKIFAELEKTSGKQRERIEKAREKQAEERRTQHKADRKNPYGRDDEESVKRTTVEAASVEEMIEKLKNLNWDNVTESYSGERFNFKA